MNLAATVCFALGLLLFLGTVVGVVRLPDLYTRMHGAAKGDTLSSMLLILGFCFYVMQSVEIGNLVLCAKFLMLIGFLFVASPTAAHALVDSAYEAGLEPWTQQGGDSDAVAS